MADLQQRTIDTYNNMAQEFVAHFNKYADRSIPKEIDLALSLAGEPKEPRVVEIGCGTGKHAAELVKLTPYYRGFDPAAELLKAAQKQVPEASFEVADALSYEYPENLDVVFAFASMLHLGKDDFATACAKVAQSLKLGGIFYMTLKEADQYKEILQEDDFGARQFFLYTPALAAELAGDAFELVHEEHLRLGAKNKPWITLLFKRVK